MRKLIYALPMIILALCASPVLANYSPFPDAKSISALPSVLLLDYASDLFFIMLSLLIIKQAGKVKLSTILKVSVFTLAAGFAADEIGFLVTRTLVLNFRGSLIMVFGGVIGVIAAISLIAYANFHFAKYYFKLNHRQSLIMGLIVGIFTMPGGILLVSGIASHFSRYNSHHYETYYTYALVGTIFAAADIILLLLMKPIAPLNRVSVGALGLVIAAGASWYCISIASAENNEYKDIMTCSSQMKMLAFSIMSYQNKYDDYPSDISQIPADLLRGQDKLHCKYDKNKSGITSYIYRKPPDDLKDSYDYWMLKCTHHPKYDLYQSAGGVSMKGLPKGGSYK